MRYWFYFSRSARGSASRRWTVSSTFPASSAIRNPRWHAVDSEDDPLGEQFARREQRFPSRGVEVGQFGAVGIGVQLIDVKIISRHAGSQPPRLTPYSTYTFAISCSVSRRTQAPGTAKFSVPTSPSEQTNGKGAVSVKHHRPIPQVFSGD